MVLFFSFFFFFLFFFFFYILFIWKKKIQIKKKFKLFCFLFFHSLLNRLVTGKFEPNYTMTVGLDYFSKKIKLSSGNFVRNNNHFKIIKLFFIFILDL